MNHAHHMRLICILIVLLIADVWSGCIKEQCPSYPNELLNSKIWRGIDSSADDFGKQVHTKLVELVSLTKPEFDVFINSTGMVKIDSTELSIRYIGFEEMASYFYQKTPFWTTRMFTYRSNAKKPYRALKKFLALRPEFKYSVQEEPGRYIMEHFTDGYKEFTVQYSPGYCFYFISYKVTEEHNYFRNCWQLTTSPSTPDSILTFKTCSSENATLGKSLQTLYLKERGEAEYSISKGKGESQIFQGKWSYNDPFSKLLRIYNEEEELVMSFKLMDIDKDQMHVTEVVK